MNETLFNLFLAFATVAVPVLTSFIANFIYRAAANVENTKAQGYLTEIGIAVSDAVAATSQTYVDALKKSGEFTVEAQKQAAQMALAACIASLTPAAKDFIEEAYGDISGYLSNKIEAEVKIQKGAV